MIAYTNGGIMSMFYIKFFINRLLSKLQTIFRYCFKYNFAQNKVYKYTTKSVYFVRSQHFIKKKNSTLGYSRSFSSGNVKLRANNYEYIKDLTSNLQAESSADAARRITRVPNPNRIAGLVRIIYTIYMENDLETKINNMNDLLSESFWTENQDMGESAKFALDKMLRHEVLEGEEAFYVDNFFIKEGISLEGLRLEDLRSKIETCQDFYIQKYTELQEKLNIWVEEKNSLLIQQQEQEDSNIDKGKQPDYSFHPSYDISSDIYPNKVLQMFSGLAIKKRKFSDLNGSDLCDDGKILKKAKITDNSSLLDDFADVSCEPLDIIDFDG